VRAQAPQGLGLSRLGHQRGAGARSRSSWEGCLWPRRDSRPPLSSSSSSSRSRQGHQQMSLTLWTVTDPARWQQAGRHPVCAGARLLLQNSCRVVYQYHGRCIVAAGSSGEHVSMC
jgi:hypothetical protein